MYSKIDKATEKIRQITRITPHAVIVLNSALASLKDSLLVCQEIDCSELDGFVPSPQPGRDLKLYYGILENHYVLLFQGKPHVYDGLSAEEMALPYRVFANLGIQNIIFANMAGAINETFEAGDIVIGSDCITLFAPSLLTGRNYDRFGPRLMDMSDVYNSEFRKRSVAALENAGIDVKTGVYAFYSGPGYETPSDVRALKAMGADLAGMSTVPEAMLCHQCGMNVLALSMISNKASGYSIRPLAHREVLKTIKHSGYKLIGAVKQIVASMPK